MRFVNKALRDNIALLVLSCFGKLIVWIKIIMWGGIMEILPSDFFIIIIIFFYYYYLLEQLQQLQLNLHYITEYVSTHYNLLITYNQLTVCYLQIKVLQLTA